MVRFRFNSFRQNRQHAQHLSHTLSFEGIWIISKYSGEMQNIIQTWVLWAQTPDHWFHLSLIQFKSNWNNALHNVMNTNDQSYFPELKYSIYFPSVCIMTGVGIADLIWHSVAGWTKPETQLQITHCLVQLTPKHKLLCLDTVWLNLKKHDYCAVLVIHLFGFSTVCFELFYLF